MSAASSAFSTDDTIVAIATPPGRGAIGIVRLSGPDALPIVSTLLTPTAILRPRVATLTRLLAPGDRVADEVVATVFNAPHSYTGDDVVELSAHGSPVVLQSIVESALRAGARLARPGEFTLRAFLRGKRDLIQAEAVGDLIAAVTPLQARVAFDQLQGTLTARIADIDRELFDLIARLEASLDFPDEGYRFVEAGSTAVLTRVADRLEHLLASGRQGRVIREGATVVISGRPNVGKSLIFNALNGADRAIVTDVAGTTRDLLTERVDIDGLSVLLVDTAGERVSTDVVESEGVRRAVQARGVADLVLLVLDGSESLSDEDRRLIDATATVRRLVVVNKSDLPPAFDAVPGAAAFVRISARAGTGIADLRTAIAAAILGGAIFGESDPGREDVRVSNTRHLHLMEEALQHVREARRAIDETVPEEFVLSHLQSARVCFDEVVGARTTDDVLTHIFERFCIGK